MYQAISWVGTELPHPQLGADVKNSVSQCSVLSVSFMPEVVTLGIDLAVLGRA